MFILITYDINTESDSGKSRLRRVAKICLNYGQRVQNSVFECQVNEAQFRQIEHELENEIDIDLDSLRFYRLGNNYDRKVKHVGAKSSYRIDKPLIL